jgi:hypothetical protein
MGGALVNATGQFGRAIGLAITTAIQTAVVAYQRNVPVEQAGKILPWDPASLKGLRVSNWFNMALAIACMIIVIVSFRGTGVVGKIEKEPRSGGEEGIMNEENIARKPQNEARAE